MNDMIIKAAQDPSCLLAVTPDRGGSWWATLRPGGNYPWPSATTRNFSEEPEYWYAAKTWFDNAPSGKMIFDFEFEQISSPATNRTQIFGNNGRGPFSCEWIISSDDRFVFRIYFYGLYDTSTIGDPYLQIIFNSSTVIGKHTVHAEAADGMFSVTMDETDVSDTRIGNRVNNSFASVWRTTADCTIQRLSIFVENYKKFSYPSEAERVRLLTKTNVRTDRGVFEAADTSKTATIATQLTDTPQTFLVFDDNGQMINSATMQGGVFTISDGKKIRALLGFDRALTAAEIAAFGVRRPRNFAEKTMTWTDAKTALDTIDQSHDFTFEIEFKCVKTNAAYVFASDGLRDFIRVFMSNGTVIVNTALLGTSSGGSTQFSAGSDSTNRHVLTVKFTGNTITASVDSEVVYTRENLFRNVIEIGTPRSNAGYVHKISVTDDTTGETVWRANHNDLFTY